MATPFNFLNRLFSAQNESPQPSSSQMSNSAINQQNWLDLPVLADIEENLREYLHISI